jgi:hypothetical protein
MRLYAYSATSFIDIREISIVPVGARSLKIINSLGARFP